MSDYAQMARGELVAAYGVLQAKLKESEERNKRLRIALELIAGKIHSDMQFRDIAIQALEK